jgi:cytochrome c biogenesis protein CcdA/thiol-disulfide isomerase/thioredoxin
LCSRARAPISNDGRKNVGDGKGACVIELLGIGVLAGVIAGISPCVLPVLPVILVAGSTEVDRASKSRTRRRALAIVAGLIVSFTVLTLAGAAILSALGLPDDFLRDLGIVALGLIGVGLVIPRLFERAEGLLARIRIPAPRAHLGGFVLGLCTGAIFVPCAGPVLAAISVLGATHHISFWTVALTLCFSAGAAVPLLALALAGDSLVRRITWLRTRTPILRRVGGAVLIIIAVAIGLNWTNGIQLVVPGYTTALQNGIENSSFARNQLRALRNEPTTASNGALQSCIPDDPAPESCGTAPNFTGITAWLNTPGDRPVSLSSLRGKVVLVDFWTYSCINCQRALPHVEAWYSRYHADGLEVVGVSTPEFAFEHVVSNVAEAAHSFGLTYPIAIDNNDATWNAYENEYWPATYLIDATGTIRHLDQGEGNYGVTEGLIRWALTQANPGVHLPPETSVPDLTPIEETTPESYLGFDRIDNLAGVSSVVTNKPATYTSPSSLALNMVGFDGTWTVGPQAITAGSMATLRLHYQAEDVYLVLGGSGTLTVRNGTGPPRRIQISGIPRLYTLVHGTQSQDNELSLNATPGVRAYDFTFG